MKSISTGYSEEEHAADLVHNEIESRIQPPGGFESGLAPKSRKALAAEKAKEGEEVACKHIASLGYRIVKRNFRFGKIGEIDIVAYDGDTLVFIEVKTRSDYSFGQPEASVDARKQSQLKKIARMYYYVNSLDDVVCRFDVIAVELLDKRVDLRHHKNAFF